MVGIEEPQEEKPLTLAEAHAELVKLVGEQRAEALIAPISAAAVQHIAFHLDIESKDPDSTPEAREKAAAMLVATQAVLAKAEINPSLWLEVIK